MKAKDVIQRLKAEGWQEMPGGKTGHRHFKHSKHPGKVTVPMHGGVIPPGGEIYCRIMRGSAVAPK